MTITDARAELETALTAGGLRVAPPGAGQIAAPAVVVVGGEPWIQSAQLGAGRQTVVLEIVGIVGGASDPLTMDALETMALAIVAALRPLREWSAPVVHRPGRTEAAGAVYTSVRVGTSRIIDTL